MSGYQFGDPEPVCSNDWFGDQVATRQIPKKAHLGFRPEPGLQQISDLCHHECGDDQRPWVVLEEFETPGMVFIVGVDVGVQGPGVDKDSYRFTSARRIASIRSEISE
jgi:hypothetical protein